MIHHHYQAYYQTLDLAAENDVAQLLFPGWRNSLEKPFLFLGDFHPCLFTNLLRSFLEDSDDSEEGQYDFINKPYQFAVAWRNASKNLMVKIEQIERGLRLMVPELNSRVRVLQGEFLERVAVKWVKYEGRKGNLRGEVEEALVGKMEEMTCAFLDANRIRRSVLSEIMGATNVYQAALFLEALSQFLVGFRNADLISEFERKRENNRV
ncbi:Transcription factor TGA like domain [Dillenia turbinata]|uniref:Transcription factor TGA like domain n=1 Tax=Dillenia turbinata TaxID=194707 RepID=A0AAN8ZUT2_9MAGN